MIDEFSSPVSNGLVAGAGGDAVIEHQAIVGEQPVDSAEVQRQVADTNMLEHPDRCDLVEHTMSRDMSVVLQAHFDFFLQALFPDALPNMLELALAERHAGGLHAVVAVGPEQQGSPTATDVQKPLTRLELQLSADQIELGLLSFIQRLLAVGKVGAGVDHLAVEP